MMFGAARRHRSDINRTSAQKQLFLILLAAPVPLALFRLTFVFFERSYVGVCCIADGIILSVAFSYHPSISSDREN